MRAFTLALAVMVLTAAPAYAAPPPVEVVHSENVQVGPYDLRASFSEWPIRAERSLDFTFVPDGGITGHQGTLRLVGPATTGRPERLARHPRARTEWGLDVRALPEEGTWQLEFTVDGPKGPGSGVLAVPVGPRPGPPATLSWTLGLGPMIVGGLVLVIVWIRGRGRRRADTWTWS
ncbi:hypothetical protein KIPE111705_29925 [Kibdelosporangium persicum]|uniref:CopC domain-containing protein n=1 Tax=Kibdelosporangium persicum TaxID=2698649 RepID=A0ABX2EVU9_9PSEU|nr:hypothetical protein [Kibdelosporangium persicum]NRN63087.1 hypothetical protein [Kibdelosporangium persicum]